MIVSFGGEVVKFAGDALYALWSSESYQASEVNVEDSKLHEANIEKCVACAIVINLECNNYKISKSYRHRKNSSSSSTSDQPMKHSLYSMDDKNPLYEEREATLNVYCGVSEGRMAGIDVVAVRRAEFFLIGQPLQGKYIIAIYHYG